MIAALLYLQLHTARNRLVSRLRRLKRPKYLAGALVGGLYLWFFFFRHWMPGTRSAWPTSGITSPDGLLLAELLGAALLLVIVLLAWIWPHKRAALEFTEAEIAFLFPAPVSRRTLIHFKLLKSQARILFSALLMTLFASGSMRFGHAWMPLLGWWLLLFTLNLHFLGASFARTMLQERGVARWKYRAGIAAGVAIALSWGLVWAVRHTAPPTPATLSSVDSAGQYVQTALGTGPAFFLLCPFRVVLRPMLAGDAGSFLLSLVPALAFTALHYLWVVRSNVAFEEASVEAARRRTELIAAFRTGTGRLTSKPHKHRKPPFQLRPGGLRFVALFWKNLIAAGRLFSVGFWLLLLWLAIFGGILLSTVAQESGLLPAAGILVLALAGMSLVMGPQVLRHDLRQDLRVADVLKMYPLSGWQVVLGEILAPTIILTGIQWVLLILAVIFFQLPGKEALPFPDRAAYGLSAAMLAPCLNAISLLVLNAAALLFPAWAHLGPGAAQGVEVMGQRLILVFGQMLAFLLALLPAALAFAGVLLGVRYVLGNQAWGMMVAAPLAGLVAAVGLGLEAGLGVRLLGGLFERFDVSEEPGI